MHKRPGGNEGRLLSKDRAITSGSAGDQMALARLIISANMAWLLQGNQVPALVPEGDATYVVS
jgi:hypothetical protein